ncbi:MAG: hypothetical protein Q4A00_07465 [Flavobacteriaceae bacterium]|nr:hypothetical protein [Flavobacteriaceae bacterium]
MPTEEQVEKIINDILSAQAEKRLSEQDIDELRNAKDTIKKLNDKLYNPEIIDKYKNEANLHFQKLFPNNRIEFEDLDKMSWTEKQIGKKFKIHFPKIDEN